MTTRLSTIAACGLVLAAAAASPSGATAANRAIPTPALSGRSVHAGAVSGVLILPRDPRALAIVIHGGEIAWNRSWAARATRVAARVYAMRLASLGIGVLSVDYRWSGYGGAELGDVDAMLTRAGELPCVARLPKILVGASHGGYLAALAATTRPARVAHVRAVVDLYGFADLGATVTGPGSQWDRQARLTLHELGTPRRHRSAYAARSPLSRAALIRVPLLQVVGGRDRDTLPDVLALSRAVRRRGSGPVTHVIPGSTHGFAFGTRASGLVWQDVGRFLQGIGLVR